MRKISIVYLHVGDKFTVIDDNTQLAKYCWYKVIEKTSATITCQEHQSKKQFMADVERGDFAVWKKD